MQRRVTLWRVVFLALAGLTLAFGGCEADPMPSPGIVNRLKLLLSTRKSSVGLVGVIGLPNAAPGLGIVVVRGDGTTVETKSNASGTFAGLIVASAGEQLSITFKTSESAPESAPVTVNVPTDTSGQTDTAAAGSPQAPTAVPSSGTGGTASGADAGTADAGRTSGEDAGPTPSVDAGTTGSPPDAGMGGGAFDAGTSEDGGTTSMMEDAGTPNNFAGPTISASAPDATGNSQITGAGFTDGESVTIGNTVSGAVVTESVSASGDLTAEIPAQQGDTLIVVVQDQAGNTSESTSLTVP